MSGLFRPRSWFLLLALFCASVLGYALYVQYVEFLDPCPLCILQRVAYMWIGLIALVAVIHNPGAGGRWFYSGLIVLGCVAGALVAARHVWLQNLPPDQVPECGMGLNYMLESLPFKEVLTRVLYGSGECAQIDWVFAGLSMPWWNLICYIGLSIITLLVLFRNRSS